MTISNFRNVRLFVDDKAVDTACVAEVDVTSGTLWWKRTTTRTVFRPMGSGFWRFADTGRFVPNNIRLEMMELIARSEHLLKE